MTATIDGSVEPGFESVRDAFRANFTEHGDIGAAFSLHVEGRKVVDLWGGTADPASGRPYTEDTLQLVFSTTKGATALCANLLAQRGQLDVDAPISRYWPEFGQAGKDAIPVRWLLCHKAGVPTIDKPLTLEEAIAWDPVINALEVQEPFWDPGTAHGYHAVTFGHLVGEVVRRISGQTLGAFFAAEVAAPLGLEFWIGLPAEQEPRVAALIGGIGPGRDLDPNLRALIEQFMGPETLLGRALTLNGAFAAPDAFGRPDVHRAEIPAANGITNARSLSRMYAAAVGSVEGGPSTALLGPAQIDAARECQTDGSDRCLVFDTKFGLGFMTSSAFAPYGGAGSFGHAGLGGSVGFADPDHQIGFGYVMNKLAHNLSGDPRTRGLVQATYDAIGVEPVHV